MRLTTRSEYALLALIYLARNDGIEYITSETISKAQAIPLAYLEHILRALKQARFLTSYKGQHGGFRLARSADEISIAEVIRLFDGALAPTQSVSEYFYEETPIQKEDKMIELFKGIRDYVANKLEETTIAEVI
ncbi:MAG: Rrf2 family transcriptional regulator [Deltaproteobacteria bacterium]|nr:Rrf2 family transcriptional regulator [Deltaproteobacteria bacterium]